MSGHRCFYFGCNSRKGIDQKVNEINFYRFPKKKETFIAWVNACQNPKIYKRSVKNVALYGMVCSKHFCYLDFLNPLVRKKVLKTDALPFSNEVTKYIVHDISDGNFIMEDIKPDFKGLAWTDSHPGPGNRAVDEHYAENVFSSPPHSPSGGSQKHKDLVSPRRLMNILESSCPLIRPISPTPSETDDTHYVGLPSLIPEVTMTTSFSPCNDSGSEEEEEEEEEEALLPSSLSPEEGGSTPASTVASFFSTPTTTVTTTNAIGTGTVTVTTTTIATTPISRGMTAKCFSEAYSPLLSASKRLLKNSADDDENEDPDWPKTASRRRSTKYKRVLPIHNKRRDESEEVVLNLSGLSIQKLEKTLKGTQSALTTNLYLDNNFLKALPAISTYKKLTKVSLVNNQIDSLSWFEGLRSLRVLNLSRNKLMDVRGLWKLWHLTHVNLSGNEIEVLKRHSSNEKSNLESVDLSDNKIIVVGDLSSLTNLKELLLHHNRIKSLSQWEKFLPLNSLVKLNLAANSIVNLSDVAELSRLENLEELSLKQNHCVSVLQLVDSQNAPIGPLRSFNYRPYVLTWCSNLTKLDDRAVEEEERIKARWLLSEEKFREISVAKHVSLVMYLSTACPLPAQPLGKKSRNMRHGQRPTAALQEKPKTVTTPRSPFPAEKVVFPLNNNNVDKRTSLLSKNVTAPEVISIVDCPSVGPCEHYVELIEEKARNHKLQRKTEILQARIDELMQKVKLLESAMVQNGLSLDDLCIKIEVEDEHME